MSPVIRITSFFVVAIMVAMADKLVMSFLGGALFLLFALQGFRGLHLFLSLLHKLRWFLLTMIILYGWMIPGDPIFTVFPAMLMPTTEGVSTGVTRLSVLLLLMACIAYLMSRTSTTELIDGVYACLAPFQFMGISRKKLTVRLVLAMELVQQVRPILEEVKKEYPERTHLRDVPQILERAFEAIVHRMDSAPLHPIDITLEGTTPIWQWLIPVGILAVLGQLHLMSAGF